MTAALAWPDEPPAEPLPYGADGACECCGEVAALTHGECAGCRECASCGDDATTATPDGVPMCAHCAGEADDVRRRLM